MADGTRTKAHIVAMLIVGGVLLFGFFGYLVFATIHFFFTNPRWLAYAFLVVFTIQIYWVLFAYLRRRFTPEESEPVVAKL